MPDEPSGKPVTDLSRVDSQQMLGPQARQILGHMLWLVIAAGTASSLYGILLNGLSLRNMGGLGLALVSLASYVLYLRGHIALAAQILVWSATGIVLTLCFVVAGVRTPALLFTPSLCMFAVWLGGLRSGVGVLLAVSVVAVGLLIGETMGYAPPDAPRTSLAVVLVLLPSVGAALLISAGALKSFQSKIELVLQLTRTQEEQLLALRGSEERFAAMFRANPVPSSTINADGSLLDVNQAWINTFGLTREQAVGQTYASLGLWQDQEAMLRSTGLLRSSGRIEGLLTQFRTAGGQFKPFLVYVSPVEFGGERRYVSSLLDQSDHLAAEAAQREQNQLLEERVRERTAELTRTVADLSAAQSELVRSEKLASLGSMVAGISHELNTPLGNTLTVATSLQDLTSRYAQKVQANQLRRSELEEFVRLCEEMSALMVRSTQRAAELIASFKQVSVDVSSQRRREFDLANVVNDTLVSLKPGMRHKNITLHVDVPASINCDSLPGAVEQVLTNLVQNAVVHGFAERGTGNITISASSDGTRVSMTVTDDGAGMSEEVLQHAFDPFFTTRMGQGGSGLGLSVSLSLAVSALRGTMSAQSSPGQGTCVTFSFQQRLDPSS